MSTNSTKLSIDGSGRPEQRHQARTENIQWYNKRSSTDASVKSDPRHKPHKSRAIHTLDDLISLDDERIIAAALAIQFKGGIRQQKPNTTKFLSVDHNSKTIRGASASSTGGSVNTANALRASKDYKFNSIREANEVSINTTRAVTSCIDNIHNTNNFLQKFDTVSEANEVSINTTKAWPSSIDNIHNTVSEASSLSAINDIRLNTINFLSVDHKYKTRPTVMPRPPILPTPL